MKRAITLDAVIKFDSEDEAGSFKTSVKRDFFVDMMERMHSDAEQTAKWMVVNHYFRFDNVKVISVSVEGLKDEVVDVAAVAKEMRGIIKSLDGVMGCHIKRWKATKSEAAHDVIYISGGSSFNIPHNERLQNTAKIVDYLEEFGLSHGFGIITKQPNTGTIWFRREVAL